MLRTPALRHYRVGPLVPNCEEPHHSLVAIGRVLVPVESVARRVTRPSADNSLVSSTELKIVLGVKRRGHRGVGVALSPIYPDVRDPVGVNRGIKSPADPRKPFIYGA